MTKSNSIKDYLVKPIVTRLTDEEAKLRKDILDYIITNHKPYFPNNNYTKELLNNMVNKDILSVNNNEVISVYPISVMETDKKIIFEDGNYGYAMCAIDAIGFHYTFMKSIKIESKCKWCDEKIIINVKNGVINVVEGGENIVILHTDLENSKNWSCNCCKIMHFFKNKENLEKWKFKNNIQQKTLSIDLETANKISWLLFSK
ncbi:organomercurial lyase [Clostridium perfringens]|uniref:organomercurial lyase n=1 Tax=Clostridium perfringens TaxID=1502 RepID=UPI00285B4192|nr:hypothetical protein [Clostridium perfringens]ELC8345846.1 hypothetical protein [Clostridium perfringens]